MANNLKRFHFNHVPVSFPRQYRISSKIRIRLRDSRLKILATLRYHRNLVAKIVYCRCYSYILNWISPRIQCTLTKKSGIVFNRVKRTKTITLFGTPSSVAFLRLATFSTPCPHQPLYATRFQNIKTNLIKSCANCTSAKREYSLIN